MSTQETSRELGLWVSAIWPLKSNKATCQSETLFACRLLKKSAFKREVLLGDEQWWVLDQTSNIQSTLGTIQSLSPYFKHMSKKLKRFEDSDGNVFGPCWFKAQQGRPMLVIQHAYLKMLRTIVLPKPLRPSTYLFSKKCSNMGMGRDFVFECVLNLFLFPFVFHAKLSTTNNHRTQLGDISITLKHLPKNFLGLGKNWFKIIGFLT